jgi:putative copper resistance protein D
MYSRSTPIAPTATFHLPIGPEIAEVEALLIGMRFVQYLAVMILFGSSLFPYYALRANELDTGLRSDVTGFVQRVALCAAFAALVSAIVWLGCEAVLMSGDASGYREAGIILTVLSDTQFGRIWGWRLVFLAVVTIFFGWRVLGGRTPLVLPALLSGLVLTVSLAGVGHGATRTGYDALFHQSNQAVHMLAAAVWVGGLVSLFYAVRRTRHAAHGLDMLTRVLGRFSAVGFAAVLFILASGLLNSWFLVGSIHALLHRVYGQVLLVKVSLFLCMIALALFNRLSVMPRLARKVEGGGLASLLLRSVAAEQILAVLVVASVSILGTLPPGMDMHGTAM